MMSSIQQEVNQRICDGITQIQADLEVTLAHVFEQAGSKLQLEGRQEFHQQIEQTKQLLEHLKSRYV